MWLYRETGGSSGKRTQLPILVNLKWNSRAIDNVSNRWHFRFLFYKFNWHVDPTLLMLLVPTMIGQINTIFLLMKHFSLKNWFIPFCILYNWLVIVYIGTKASTRSALGWMQEYRVGWELSQWSWTGWDSRGLLCDRRWVTY